MSIEAYAAAEHVVDAGHVQVSADGIGTSVVDAILTANPNGGMSLSMSMGGGGGGGGDE